MVAFRLARVPLFFSAIADSATGYLLGIQNTGDLTFFDLFLLACSSSLLYCGGMVLNDVADSERDRELHPSRPISSGRVQVNAAFTFGFFLLLGGLLCAWTLGPLPGYASAGLVFAIILYDFFAKNWGPIGCATMALTRAGNVALGFAASGSLLSFSKTAGCLYGAVFIYVFAITSISLLEEHPHRRGRLLMSLMLASFAIVPSCFLPAHIPPPALWLGFLLLILLIGRAVVTYRASTREEIGRTVGWMIRGLILLEGAFVMQQGLVGGAIVLLALGALSYAASPLPKHE